MTSTETLTSTCCCMKNSLTCILKILISEREAQFEYGENAFGATHSDSARNFTHKQKYDKTENH